jgi:hypothetical protein
MTAITEPILTKTGNATTNFTTTSCTELHGNVTKTVAADTVLHGRIERRTEGRTRPPHKALFFCFVSKDPLELAVFEWYR